MLTTSQYITESYILSNETISIDLDKFLSGESNILLVVGNSGAGKSTLCEYLGKKYNVEAYDVDMCKKGGELYRQMQNAKPKDEFTLFPDDYWYKIYKWCIKDKIKDKKTRRVMAGSALFQVYYIGTPTMKKELLKHPTIFLGKSALNSTIDRVQRKYRKEKYKNDNIKQRVRSVTSSVQLTTELNKQISKYKKDRLKLGGKIESFHVPKLTPSIYKGL
jgi:adenylate kinase family enzyme